MPNQILETERLALRELDSALDAEFIFRLLNTPKFLRFIGDRGVRSVENAAAFIDERYCQSYRDHDYGLYLVELKQSGTGIGVCGFVRRETLPGPDIGFAFLPEFEGKGFGLESAQAVMRYGQETLGFTEVFAITSLDNTASGRLLEKLGFKFDELLENGDETIKLFVHKKQQ